MDQWWVSDKEFLNNAGDVGLIPGSGPWVRKISWRRKWQPTPVFLPEKSHGQGSLAGCGPQGHKRVEYGLVTRQQQQ